MNQPYAPPDLSKEFLYLSLLQQSHAALEAYRKMLTRIEVFETAFPELKERLANA